MRSDKKCLCSLVFGKHFVIFIYFLGITRSVYKSPNIYTKKNLIQRCAEVTKLKKKIDKDFFVFLLLSLNAEQFCISCRWDLLILIDCCRYFADMLTNHFCENDEGVMVHLQPREGGD